MSTEPAMKYGPTSLGTTLVALSAVGAIALISARAEALTSTERKKMRTAQCKGKKNKIYYAEKAGQNVRYYFCDTTMVMKRPNGSMAVKTSAPAKHPAYDEFTHAARTRLEVAEHNAKVLKSNQSRLERDKARTAFQRRVKKFMKKHGWSKKKYIRAVKRSKIAVVEKT